MLTAVVLLMTGCIKLNMDLKVSSNNKVSGTVIVGFNKQLLSLSGQSVDQVLQGSHEGVPASGAPGTSVTPYEDDQFAGEKITYDNVELSQFNQGSASDSLKIERVGDQFQVSGALDFSDTGRGGGTLGPAAQQALSSAQLSVKLTFPGAVSSSNGTVQGDSVTWTPKIGKKTPLTAVAGAIGSGGGLPTWVVPAAVLLLLVGIGVFWLDRRRRLAAPAAPAMPLEGPIEPPPPPEAPVS